MKQTALLPEILDNAIVAISKLPGIGKKSALRIALHYFSSDTEYQQELLEVLTKLKSSLIYCSVCHNISEHKLCKICANPARDKSIVCVVEQVKDMISVESTLQYNGTYHILNGVIAPLEGVGPDKLTIESLINRTNEGGIKEIILALNPTNEGDTTVYYLQKVLNRFPDILISTIARGVSFGSELEFTDAYTLGKAIEKRIKMENFKK